MERKPRLRQKFQKLWVTSSPGSHLETAVDLGILGEKTNHDVAAFAIDSLRSPGGVFTKISSKRPWGGMEVGTHPGRGGGIQKPSSQQVFHGKMLVNIFVDSL